MERLISEYINKISISDINIFASKNNIHLNNDELNLIYSYVKNDWKTIIYGNYNVILNDLKNKIDSNKYNQIEQLFYKFKSKYKNLL